MKFSFKVAIFSFLIIVSSLGIGGFLIINSCFNNELSININNAKENNEYLSTIYYNIASNNINSFTKNTSSLLKEFQTLASNGQISIGDAKSIKYYDKNTFLNKLNTNEQGSQIIDVNGIKYLQVISKLNINDTDIYFENLIDISGIYDLRNKNYQIYCLFLVTISLICFIITYLYSLYLTKPLNKIKRTSKRIANGALSERIVINKKEAPEFTSLANDFNNMTDKLEEYIKNIEDYNKSQDEFIARFTHELKTPLTSIIGYADILRTSDNISLEKNYELANYIYKEGKRLEDLSHNLLDLILLKKDTFKFKKCNTKIIFADLKNGVMPLLKKYDIELELNVENANILVVPTLLTSLLYNLIDNSCKASNKKSKIVISGVIKNNRYLISVKDFGKGIPQASINKVTQAFYMVDKSRARKQGGAGIGLSLCEEIANIHNSTLTIESTLNVGTKISFDVEVVK